jgi:hypothetical protein
MPVRKAEIVAQQLATLCRTTVGIARSKGVAIEERRTARAGGERLRHRIAEIRQRPENALAPSHGLRAVHDTLLLITTETAKSPAGMPAIVDNAPALVQQSLSRILALSGAQVNPAAIDAGSLLATISQTASLMPLPATPAPSAASDCPTFGEVTCSSAKAYVRLRVERGLNVIRLAGPGLARVRATAEVAHSGFPYDVPHAWSLALSRHRLGRTASPITPGMMIRSSATRSSSVQRVPLPRLSANSIQIRMVPVDRRTLRSRSGALGPNSV